MVTLTFCKLEFTNLSIKPRLVICKLEDLVLEGGKEPTVSGACACSYSS